MTEDKELWEDAIAHHADELGTVIAEEIEEWMQHAGTWRDATETHLEQAATLVPWLWEALTYLAAVRARLISAHQLHKTSYWEGPAERLCLEQVRMRHDAC